METLNKKNRPSKPGIPEKGKSQFEQKEGKYGVKALSNNDKPGPPSDNDQLASELEKSSNKGQGPAGENL
jgi:hypothetical protein